MGGWKDHNGDQAGRSQNRREPFSSGVLVVVIGRLEMMEASALIAPPAENLPSALVHVDDGPRKEGSSGWDQPPLGRNGGSACAGHSPLPVRPRWGVDDEARGSTALDRVS